ncbi:hypothetical protein BOSEA31B_12454 [Hyphomicrobiales bacterium]|nr:hypothetical protein BOSEA31B_12454 [Hyphomicrobiales bacterium]CAH1698233.1 hypothetical protein BOSEA1005_11278 [Hyphomicrobiales bacterium]CAI0347877.1 hypothetical protein BO1005MUT1_90238 [Hyphomicrobiales bacterium]
MAERVELFERLVADLQFPRAVGAVRDRHRKAKCFFERLLERPRIRILGGLRLGRDGAFRLAARFRLHNTLDVADAEPLVDDLPRHQFRVRNRQQSPGMTGRNRALADHFPHGLGQLRQAQRVGDMATALADDACKIVLRIVELGNQPLVAGCLFDRIEIRALHVLDDGDLQRLAIIGFDENDRDIVQLGALRRPPAPLAGDDLIGIDHARNRADDDRLQNAAFANRIRQLVEILLDEAASRIAGARAQELDRNPALTTRTLDRTDFLTDIADQRCQTATKAGTPLFFGHRHPRYLILSLVQAAARKARSRLITSDASRR